MEQLFIMMFDKLGPFGLLLFGVGWIVWRFDKQLEVHRVDRNRWLEDSERLTNKMIDALNSNTEAMTEVVVMMRERGNKR